MNLQNNQQAILITATQLWNLFGKSSNEFKTFNDLRSDVKERYYKKAQVILYRLDLLEL